MGVNGNGNGACHVYGMKYRMGKKGTIGVSEEGMGRREAILLAFQGTDRLTDRLTGSLITMIL